MQKNRSMDGFKQWVKSMVNKCDLTPFIPFRLTGVRLTLTLCCLAAVSANAAVSDCAGTSADGQAVCVVPEFQPAKYGVCTQSTNADTAFGVCYGRLGISGSITSESQLISLVDCAVKWYVGGTSPQGWQGPINWYGAGQSYYSNQCNSRTVYVQNGVEVRGVAVESPPWGFPVIFYRDRPAYCKPGYTEVTQYLNGITEIISCKSPCPAGTIFS